MEVGATLQLDSSGDLVIGQDHRIKRISGTDKTRQDLAVILRSAAGSLATDPEFGTDIAGLIAANANPSLITGIIRTALLQYRYTRSVDSVTVSGPDKDRRISITASVTLTDNTTITVEGVL